ncbi:hypothetical protein IKE96_01050 [bacterium]|nr:hypothetical protein [bacterium]
MFICVKKPLTPVVPAEAILRSLTLNSVCLACNIIFLNPEIVNLNSLSKSFTVTSILFPLTIETGSEILSNETTPSVIVNNLYLLNQIQFLVITLRASEAATLSKLKLAAVKSVLTSILGTKFFIVNKTLLVLTLRAILTSFWSCHIHSGPPILVI